MPIHIQSVDYSHQNREIIQHSPSLVRNFPRRPSQEYVLRGVMSPITEEWENDPFHKRNKRKLADEDDDKENQPKHPKIDS